MTDQKLIDEQMKIADREYKKRNAEFCDAIGITPEQYELIVRQMPEVKVRPFFNSPLARDAFVLGYVVSHGKHK